MDAQKQIATPDNLRRRVLEIKNQLPGHYTSMIIDLDPSLKGEEEKIRRVVALQVTDEEITIALENFVKAIN